MKTREKKNPYMMYFPSDWLGDPRVTSCSCTTRSIWWDLISTMHLTDRNGILRGTPAQLARHARCSESELEAALTDIQETAAGDVFRDSKTGIVTVVNRRMKREADKRASQCQRTRKHRSKDSVARVERSGNDLSNAPNSYGDGDGNGIGSEGKEGSGENPNDPDRDELDFEILRYFGEHNGMTYSHGAHGKMRRLVQSAGWDNARRCIDEALKNAAGNPTAYALTVWTGKQAKLRLKQEKVETPKLHLHRMD